MTDDAAVTIQRVYKGYLNRKRLMRVMRESAGEYNGIIAGLDHALLVELRHRKRELEAKLSELQSTLLTMDGKQQPQLTAAPTQRHQAV